MKNRMRERGFTPYNPENPSLQSGNEGDLKSKVEGKSFPLGYTGFTPYNPKNPSLQSGNEGDLKSKVEGKSFPLGYTGFTLIEILIVVVIIGLLAALVGPKLFGKVGGARQKAAKAQIELFGTALDTFRLDVGKYPTSEEGLKALREKPSAADGWEGPYLPKEIPNDPWGTPYVYRCPGQNGDYDMLSLGLDKAEGGEGENQDIVSWRDIVK